MSEKIKQVAERIKGLREIAGLEVEAIARELRVDPDEYRKYESGTTDIPVGFLIDMAHRFDVELTVLLTGEEPRLRTYCLVRADKAPTVDRRKEYRYRDLAYNFIGKRAEAFLVRVDPKPPKAKPHTYSHPGQEFNYVLKGTIKVTVNGHELTLHAGDSLYFDSGKDHAMTAVGDEPAEFLAVIL
ncbi:MAG: helix-turn-helix domain-containing protein [Candidatus Aminicenantales bacterium]